MVNGLGVDLRWSSGVGRSRRQQIVCSIWTPHWEFMTTCAKAHCLLCLQCCASGSLTLIDICFWESTLPISINFSKTIGFHSISSRNKGETAISAFQAYPVLLYFQIIRESLTVGIKTLRRQIFIMQLLSVATRSHILHWVCSIVWSCVTGAT